MITYKDTNISLTAGINNIHDLCLVELLNMFEIIGMKVLLNDETTRPGLRIVVVLIIWSLHFLPLYVKLM